MTRVTRVTRVTRETRGTRVTRVTRVTRETRGTRGTKVTRETREDEGDQGDEGDEGRQGDQGRKERGVPRVMGNRARPDRATIQRAPLRPENSPWTCLECPSPLERKNRVDPNPEDNLSSEQSALHEAGERISEQQTEMGEP